MAPSIQKIILIILIQIIVALIHIFRLGQLFNGQTYIFYYSYFSDFIIPFSAYFLLSLNDTTIMFLRKWYVKAGLIFLVGVVTEISQFFGFELLGVTFDPIDIIMFGVGALGAALIDVKIFSKYFKFWSTPMAN